MVSPNSPIIDYFPNDFECDLNGKQQEWEAVVLIPFIDEKRLLVAMKSVETKLAPKERARKHFFVCTIYVNGEKNYALELFGLFFVKGNIHGPMRTYRFNPLDSGQFEAPAFFPPVTKNHAKRTDVSVN